MRFLETPNRTLCDVLKEMRDYISVMDNSRSHLVLRSLVEELQIMGNRMEAGLWDKHDVLSLRDEKKKLKKQVRKLKEKVNELKGDEDE